MSGGYGAACEKPATSIFYAKETGQDDSSDEDGAREHTPNAAPASGHSSVQDTAVRSAPSFIKPRTCTRIFSALAEARARAPRDLSGAGKLERASKVYHKLAVKYHLDHSPATAEVMKDLNELWQALKNA